MENVKSKQEPVLLRPGRGNREEEHSNVAELAWEYCARLRRGEKPARGEYQQRLADRAEREEFEFLVDMNEFVEHAVGHNVTTENTQ
jgi:hypothetical protein